MDEIPQYPPILYDEEFWREDFYHVYHDLLVRLFSRIEEKHKKYITCNVCGQEIPFWFLRTIHQYRVFEQEIHQVKVVCYKLNGKFLVFMRLMEQDGRNNLRYMIRPINLYCYHDRYSICYPSVYKKYPIEEESESFKALKEAINDDDNFPLELQAEILYHALDELPELEVIPLLDNNSIIQTYYINRLSDKDYSFADFKDYNNLSHLIMQLILSIIHLNKLDKLKGNIVVHSDNYIVIKIFKEYDKEYYSYFYVPEMDKVAYFNVENNPQEKCAYLHIRMENIIEIGSI